MSKWLEVKNSSNDESSIDELYIYGEIGSWWDELDAKTLADRVKNSTGDTIKLRINSGGGNVFTAMSLYSLLKTSGKKIIAHVDGVCASAATFLPCAAEKVIMTVGGQFMIHDPLTSIYGNAKDMRKAADLLDSVGGSIAMLYKEKTGKDIDDILDKMDAETWMNANEAKEYGFVSDLLETSQLAATAEVINLTGTRFKNLPKALLNNVESNKTKGVTKVMNLAELQANHPDIYQAALEQGKTSVDTKTIEANAAKAERERIGDIQASAMPGHESIVAEAIENGWDAGKFAIAALKADKEKGAEFIQKRNNDANPTAQIPPSDDNPEKTNTAESALAAAFGVEVK